MEKMKNMKIAFTGPNTAEYISAELKNMEKNDVLVKTCVSTISCGTEKANITGDPNCSPCTSSEISWPRVLGYSSAGIVLKKGAGVSGIEIGDRVAMSWSQHKKYNVLSADNVVKLPDDISFAEGAICHICTFPIAAIRKTRLEMGESLMVMGLGTLGFLAVQFAKAAGAVPVIAVDPIKERREAALKFGADYAFVPFEADFADKVKSVTDGGVNAAVEVTGIGAGLNETLDCMAKFGRVSLLGCTRDKNFTVDYYRKVHGPGITLIGAHTMARPEFESHPGWFTKNDDMKTAIKLAHAGRIDLKSIIDETHTPQECAEVYKRLVNDKNFPAIVQFDWTKEES